VLFQVSVHIGVWSSFSQAKTNWIGGLGLSYVDAKVRHFDELVKSGRIRLGFRDRQSAGSTDDIATAVASKLQPMIIDAVRPMVATLVQPMAISAMSAAITSAVTTALQSALPRTLLHGPHVAESSSENAALGSERWSNHNNLPHAPSPTSLSRPNTADNSGKTPPVTNGDIYSQS
jgi:hypothetical protein